MSAPTAQQSATQATNNTDPIGVENLDVAPRPLRFIEFSLEDVQQATLFDPTGRCVVVSLPAPARYAVHKLLIVGERTGQFKAKVSKDLAQAASLLEYFSLTDPDAVRLAWADALARGPGWRKRAREGKRALARSARVLAEELLTQGRLCRSRPRCMLRACPNPSLPRRCSR